MYCSTCREERIATSARCKDCGGSLTARTLAELVADLGHVRFVLEELRVWNLKRVPFETKAYLLDRYEEQERALVQILAKSGAAPVAVQVVEEPASTPAEVPLSAEAPAEAPQSLTPAHSERERATSASVLDEPVPAPLHEEVAEALFAAAPPPAEARAIEEASSWHRLWKPFLYESIGWFVGAFLILAGTFYFVAESWAAMSSLGRSLTVFGVTAALSAAFSFWGAFLGRREVLASAGRVLGLIGAATAPLAAIALSPLSGEAPLLLSGATAGWTLLAAFLARGPAKAFTPDGAAPLLALLAATTLMMGIAPWLARGTPALWLNLLPIIAFHVIARRGGSERTPTTVAFLAFAPAYLIALFAIRLHLALAQADQLPPLGTYGPFLAAAGLAALGLAGRDRTQPIDGVRSAILAVQVLSLLVSAAGEWPSFFVTALVVAATTWQFSRGEPRHARWLYATYVFAFLAYQTAGQLLPGYVRTLLQQLGGALGYGSGELPFNFDALYAVPYVAAGAFLAVRQLAVGNERATRVGEVLVRATTVAIPLVSVLSFGADPRPSLVAIPVLVVIGAALGLSTRRRDVLEVSVVTALGYPFVVALHVGAGWASVASSVVALAISAVGGSRREPVELFRTFRFATVAAAAFVGFAVFYASPGPLPAIAAGVAAGALFLEHRHRPSEWLGCGWPTFAAGGLVLTLHWLVPVVTGLDLAFVALAFAVLAALDERRRAFIYVAALFAGLSLFLGYAADVSVLPARASAFVSALALLVATRREKWFGAAAALVAMLALLPHLGDRPAWPEVDDATSLLLITLAMALTWGASVLRGRTPFGAVFSALSLLVTSMLALKAPSLPHPSLWAAAVAILGARSLHPWVSVPLASLWAMHAFIGLSPWVSFVTAILLAALAQPELERVAKLLFGDTGRGTSRGRTLLPLVSAGFASLGVLVTLESGGSVAWDRWVLIVVLSLAWLRGSGRPQLLAIAPALLALLALGSRSSAPWWTLAGYAVAVGRGLWHVPNVGRLLLGDADSSVGAAKARAASDWLFLGLLLPAVALIADRLLGLELIGLSHAALPLVIALLLTAGGWLWSRALAAAILALFVRDAQVPLTFGLLAVSSLAHVFPEALHRFAAAREGRLGQPAVAGIALGLSLGTWAHAEQAPWMLAGAGVAWIVGAFLLRVRWLVTVGVLFVGAALGWTEPPPGELFVWLGALAFFAAILAALFRSARVQDPVYRFAERFSPGLTADLGSPLWLAALLVLLPTLALAVITREHDSVARLLLTATAVLLSLSPRRAQAAVGVLAIGTVIPLWITDTAWTSLAVALVALTSSAIAVAVRRRVPKLAGFAAGLLAGGVALALIAPFGLTQLTHPAVPLVAAAMVGVAWCIVAWEPGLEPLGWIATVLGAHAIVFHLGVVYSSGRGREFILPYVGAASAWVASAALVFASAPRRRMLGIGLGAFALVELAWGVGAIAGAAPREALVAGLSLLVLCAAALSHSVRAKDATTAYLAQAALVLGYLVLRLHGFGVEDLGLVDSLVALVAGAVFSGLTVWARREQKLELFEWPARVGALVVPLLGLIVAPWDDLPVTAALLVGHAAHFAALAASPKERRWSSLVAGAAFNGALVLAWLGTGAGEPQYYVIPAGLSLLALVAVFKRDLEPLTAARLRAVAVTAIYAAAAWKPLAFDSGSAMLVCVAVCLVGVAVGIALRIRSYVYLGTVFLVLTVITNLVRYGARDHRVAAVCLFLLGITVVGFMVMLTAYRAQLLDRYQRMQALLSEWEK